MEISIFNILIPLFGGFLQELFHWYGLRAKLDQKRYQNLIKSKAYWVITILMIVSSGIGTYIWFLGEKEVEPKVLLITGIAFPLIIKKVLSSFQANRPVQLGGFESNQFKSYFEG